MSQKTKTDLTKYIVNVQGKDFITFPGLLMEAHAQGLTSVNTEFVNNNLQNPVVKATVTLVQEGVTKVFTGYGDSNENNVAKLVSRALLRMSETRAVARALRFATGIDMTAFEELDVSNDSDKKDETTTNSVRSFGSLTSRTQNTTQSSTKSVPTKSFNFGARPTKSTEETTTKTETPEVAKETKTEVTIETSAKPVSNGTSTEKPTFRSRVKPLQT